MFCKSYFGYMVRGVVLVMPGLRVGVGLSVAVRVAVGELEALVGWR